MNDSIGVVIPYLKPVMKMIRGYVSAFFTRKNGFEIIANNIGADKRTLVPLLLSFTPQGKSPEYSEILKHHELGLFASYFSMINEEDFFLVLFQLSLPNDHSYLPIKVFDQQVHNLAIGLARREHTFQEITQRWPASENISPFPYLPRESISSLIFSLLVGDNIVIVSNNQKRRQDFFEIISHLLPFGSLQYNSFTMFANELKNNLNIVGVSKRPSEKDVRKQLGLDSIIIDLDEGTLEGEGAKTTDICEELSEKLVHSVTEYKLLLNEYLKSWVASGYSPDDSIDPRDQVLIRRIGARTRGMPDEPLDPSFFDF